jgi:hypothetical protein
MEHPAVNPSAKHKNFPILLECDFDKLKILLKCRQNPPDIKTDRNSVLVRLPHTQASETLWADVTPVVTTDVIQLLSTDHYTSNYYLQANTHKLICLNLASLKYQKNPMMTTIPFSTENCVSSTEIQSLSHLTSYTCTKSNLYFINSLADFN